MSYDLRLWFGSQSTLPQEWQELLDWFHAKPNPYKLERIEQLPYLVSDWYIPVGSSSVILDLKRRHERLVWDFPTEFKVTITSLGDPPKMWLGFTFCYYALHLLPNVCFQDDQPPPFTTSDPLELEAFVKERFRGRHPSWGRYKLDRWIWTTRMRNPLRQMGLIDEQENWILDVERLANIPSDW